MNGQHTPEPWTLVEVGNKVKRLCPAKDNVSILTVAFEPDDDGYATPFGAVYERDDARRIVACVNACAGIETESLEADGYGDNWAEIARQRNQYESDREALLAACRLGDFLGNEGPFLLRTAAQLVRKFAPNTADELERKADAEAAAIAKAFGRL